MSLRLLLEGESLLNDASSITLFTIFLSEVKDYRNNIVANGGQVLGSIVSQMLLLAVGEIWAQRISPAVPKSALPSIAWSPASLQDKYMMNDAEILNYVRGDTGATAIQTRHF